MNKEIENHNALTTWKEQEQERTTLNKQLDYDVREAQGIQNSIDTLTEEMTQLGGETCPLCKQGLQKVDGQEIEKIVAHKKSSIQQHTEKHIHIQQNLSLIHI